MPAKPTALTSALDVPEALWGDLRLAWPNPVTDSGFLGLGAASVAVIGPPQWFTLPPSNGVMGFEAFTLAVTLTLSLTWASGPGFVWTVESSNRLFGAELFVDSGTLTYQEAAAARNTVFRQPLTTTAGAITHVAVTRTTSVVALYYDGALVQSVSGPTSWQTAWPTCIGHVYGTFPYSAGMRDLYLFSRALAPVEVLQLYQSLP